jgi:hypothetical protein
LSQLLSLVYLLPVITADTTQKGRLYVSIYWLPKEPPVFAEPEAVIQFPDGAKRLVPASDKRDLRGLEADSFRLTVPAFRLQGVAFRRWWPTSNGAKRRNTSCVVETDSSRRCQRAREAKREGSQKGSWVDS